MDILIVNGPNLNLLGKREPAIYGYNSMDEILTEIKETFPNFNVMYFQSNIEGEIINRLQDENYEALIINPGAYSHYSIAIADALKNITRKKIEVHISNIYSRERFRQKSITASSVDSLISGFGIKGYLLAVYSLSNG